MYNKVEWKMGVNAFSPYTVKTFTDYLVTAII